MDWLKKPLIQVAFIVLIALLPNLISEEFRAWLAPKIPHYERWGLGLFVFLVGLQILLDRKSNTEKDAVAPPALLDHEDLKKKYEARRDQKMGGRLPINLRRIDFTETAAQLSNKKFQAIAPEVVGGEIVELFKRSNGRLLVVGQPGAGKTSLLLDLAIGLCEAETWPILVNLATFSAEFGSLEAWLKKFLPVELGISASPRTIEKLLGDPRSVLLFDGLDEIAEADGRRKCLESIDLFGADRARRYAISSRKTEFLETKKDAHVQFCVEVGPLDFEQIRTELERRGKSQPEDLALLAALEADPFLRASAEVPFYFNCLQILFSRNNSINALQFKTLNLANRNSEILEAFVKFELSQTNQVWTTRWLSFLADRMNLIDSPSLDLNSIQCNWKKGYSFKEKIILNFFHIGSQNLVYFSIMLLGFNLISEINLSIAGIATVFAALLISLNMTIKNKIPLITVEGIEPIQFRSIISFLINNPQSLIFGSALGYQIQRIEGISPLVKFFLTIAAFVFGSIGLVFERFVERYSRDQFLAKKPYQKFRFAAKSLNFSIFVHLILRWQLHKKGLLPLRLVDFLNEMSAQTPQKRRFTKDGTKVYLLETDGASWRFRHRLIQEWFAARWQEPEK